MEVSTEGETDEHVQFMKLMMCQGERSEESHQSPAAESIEQRLWENVTAPNPLNEFQATDENRLSCLNMNSMGLVTQADVFMSCQPGSRNKSPLVIAEEINKQILRDELPMYPDSSGVTSLMNTIPGISLAQNLNNGNNLGLYGLMNIEPNDSADMEDPALSAVGLDFFESSDMIASSEKDILEFNEIFQGAEVKPKKEKKPKRKSGLVKKSSMIKKPVLVSQGSEPKKISQKLEPKRIVENTLSYNQVPHWAKAYLDLFKCQPWNFEAEKKFNERTSMKYPHCSICSLLQPRILARDPTKQKTLDQASKSIIPTMSVPETIDLYKGRLKRNMTTDTKESVLLKCASCKVCVHAFCYGNAEGGHEWICSRCIKGDENVACCLCNLKGGALTLTTKNKWCHVVCALLNTDVHFTESIRLGGIDVSNIPKVRKSMKCGYCSSFHKGPEVAGGIVQCTTAKCCVPFHVTCAHAAGVVFQPDEKHFPVFTMCHKHIQQEDIKLKGCKRHLAELQVGDKVITKHKNSRYYTCEIVTIHQELFCKAAFEDGSQSTNLYPEDFKKLDIRKDGPPDMESSVEVFWRPDGLIYNAIFKGTHSIPYYDVRFDDDSRAEDLTRDDLYTLNEKLPQKVKSKLSEITLSRSDKRNTPSDGKRSRQPNPLYFGRSYVKK